MFTLLIHGPLFDPHNQKIKTKQNLYKLSFSGNWLKTRSPGHVRQAMDQSIHICSIIHAPVIILHLHFVHIWRVTIIWELIHAITRPKSHQQIDIGLYSSRVHKCMCMSPSLCKQMCTFSLSVKGICLSSSKKCKWLVFLILLYPMKSFHILLLTLFQMRDFFSIDGCYMNICR